MTQEEGALLSTKSEFDVEFDRVNCRIEDVDSVVCFSAISLNSYGRPVNWATFTDAWATHSNAVVLRQKTSLCKYLLDLEACFWSHVLQSRQRFCDIFDGLC